MERATNIVHMYFGGRDIGLVDGKGIPTLSAEPIPEQNYANMNIPAQTRFTFTCKNAVKLPKSLRRIPICKGRKHFIKKMMAIGYKRNMQ